MISVQKIPRAELCILEDGCSCCILAVMNRRMPHPGHVASNLVLPPCQDLYGCQAHRPSHASSMCHYLQVCDTRLAQMSRGNCLAGTKTSRDAS